jgi:hypothetical protein
MNPRSNRLKRALSVAVESRSIGESWEKIAGVLKRKERVIKKWPLRYAEYWQRLQREADIEQAEETAREVVYILRKLFRAETTPDKIKAANLLIRLLIERQKIDLRAMEAGLLRQSTAEDLEQLVTCASHRDHPAVPYTSDSSPGLARQSELLDVTEPDSRRRPCANSGEGDCATPQHPETQVRLADPSPLTPQLTHDSHSSTRQVPASVQLQQLADLLAEVLAFKASECAAGGSDRPSPAGPEPVS